MFAGLKKRLIRRSEDMRCYYCKRRMLPDASVTHPLWPTVEHRQPRSRGGWDYEPNAVLACRACNNLKGSLTEDEFETVVLWLVREGIPLKPTKWRDNGMYISYRQLMSMEEVRQFFGSRQGIADYRASQITDIAA